MTDDESEADLVPASREPPPRAVTRVSPLVRRLVAPNPSPFTFNGTCTYIVGEGKVAIVDPGPEDDTHLSALLAAVKGEQVDAILVTGADGYIGRRLVSTLLETTTAPLILTVRAADPAELAAKRRDCGWDGNDRLTVHAVDLTTPDPFAGIVMVSTWDRPPVGSVSAGVDAAAEAWTEVWSAHAAEGRSRSFRLQ